MFNIRFKPWDEDRWLSMITDPFPHPDKLGHFIAHAVTTFLFVGITRLVLGSPDLILAMAWDLWFNTQVEIMDGTRPRRKLYRFPFTVVDQTGYEEETIEGFSLKDWFAGLWGSAASGFIILYVLRWY